MARFLPGSTTLRPFLHRLRGAKIHGKVFIGDDVYLENEYPERVEIHDGAAILVRSTLIAHFDYREPGGQGKIIIEKNAVILANCTIVCSPGHSLTIGEGSVISAGSVVQFARITAFFSLFKTPISFIRSFAFIYSSDIQ